VNIKKISDTSQQKIRSEHAQSSQKCSNIKIWTKSKENDFRNKLNIDQGHASF
jgi:hypothetical protein